MVVGQCPQGLRRRLAQADHELADAGLADVDAEFQEFAALMSVELARRVALKSAPAGWTAWGAGPHANRPIMSLGFSTQGGGVRVSAPLPSFGPAFRVNDECPVTADFSGFTQTRPGQSPAQAEACPTKAVELQTKGYWAGMPAPQKNEWH